MPMDFSPSVAPDSGNNASNMPLSSLGRFNYRPIRFLIIRRSAFRPGKKVCRRCFRRSHHAQHGGSGSGRGSRDPERSASPHVMPCCPGRSGREESTADRFSIGLTNDCHSRFEIAVYLCRPMYEVCPFAGPVTWYLQRLLHRLGRVGAGLGFMTAHHLSFYPPRASSPPPDEIQPLPTTYGRLVLRRGHPMGETGTCMLGRSNLTRACDVGRWSMKLSSYPRQDATSDFNSHLSTIRRIATSRLTRSRLTSIMWVYRIGQSTDMDTSWRCTHQDLALSYPTNNVEMFQDEAGNCTIA
ncbi:hypothetical protein GGR50DRAFT_5626 [Xylaria sp. CBS 124048]|nr:hypothetical protein GGR50DRAFT_5626 [Xylaria sp. CBS 124048]